MTERTELEAIEIVGRVECLYRHHPSPTRPQIKD